MRRCRRESEGILIGLCREKARYKGCSFLANWLTAGPSHFFGLMLESTLSVALKESEISMSKWIFALALVSVPVFSKAPAQSNKTLVGTWKLEFATITTDKGEVRNSWGEHPIGFLTYTEDGRMSAILTLDDRKPLSVWDFISAPANERADAFASMTAYAGRYTFTGQEVVHHVEAASMPNDVGTDLKRSVKLDGDQLILLVAKPYLRGGIIVRSQELIWKRLK
jgi:hypothetical protein